MNEIIVSIIALSGVIIGSILAFLFNSKVNRSSFNQNTELQAYLNYIDAISGIKFSLQDGKDENEYRNYLKLLTKAKAEISILGSKETIQYLIEFEKNDPIIRDRKSSELFVKILQSMRKSLKKDSIQFEDLKIVLLGKNGA